jgi:hypothetical protein
MRQMTALPPASGYCGNIQNPVPRYSGVNGSNRGERARFHSISATRHPPELQSCAVPGCKAAYNAASVNAAREAEEVHGGRSSSLHIAR